MLALPNDINRGKGAGNPSSLQPFRPGGSAEAESFPSLAEDTMSLPCPNTTQIRFDTRLRLS